jgi:type VI secretion system secreted protein VgrG
VPDEGQITEGTYRLWLSAPGFGDDDLILTGFNGSESLSRPFSYSLDMISPLSYIDPARLLGKQVSWAVRSAEGDRPFSGIMRQLVRGERWARGYYAYHAEIVPWLWLLSRRADCRIFQNKSVKDIIEQVFKANDKALFDLSGIKGSHPTREYCVQYRETDFNFVSRLMEEEGIFYYFRHDKMSHKMMLGDDLSAFYTCEDAEVEYRTNPDLTQHISAWNARNEFRTGVWTQNDYDFEHPSRNMQTNKNTLLAVSDFRNYEIYDYPGGYVDKSVGDTLTKLRMEEEEAPFDEIDGQGTCVHFSPGAKFKVVRHELVKEEEAYTLLATNHHATDNTHMAGQGGSPTYANSFVCVPSRVLFRPPRITPKPVIHGPQTAVVVGPSGEEIYCDEYGRIKVQFHWDRLGKNDENSSCFIRVAQWVASKQWGSVFTPRIGMEVIVQFLEGDPDRPLVIGTVYNGDNMPPWALPDNKTQSGFKSRSSLKGGAANFNELRFEDKKGNEDVVFHGEKDFHRSVEHDDVIEIGNDQTITVQNNRTETVKEGNDTITLEQGNRSLTVKMGDRTTEISMGSDTLEAMQKITLKVGQSSITIDQTSITLQSMQINITGQLTVNINGMMTTVDGSAVLSLGGGLVTIG